MESFLSRVTGKTFPGSDWSPFDEFLICEIKAKATILILAPNKLARIQNHHNKSKKVVKTLCDV